MMLWLAHCFPGEPWAKSQTARSLQTLDVMWVEPPGYFCRAPWLRDTRFAFTNFGVSLGLQAADVWPERVQRINTYFENWRSGDEYDREAITWVMACTSHLPGAFVGERPTRRRPGLPVNERDRRKESPNAPAVHSHSIVAGGLPEMSYTTREMPRSSLMMRLETLARKSYGKCAQCAVMKSIVCTARSAITHS